MLLRIFFSLNIFVVSILAQFSDTTHYSWPVPPLNSSQSITGAFGEFRNTLSSDHFHNAVDIAEPNNNPVYPSVNGVVYSKDNNGYNSYINVKSTIGNKKKHFTYYHVVPNPSLSIGQSVIAGQTVIGTIYDGAAHVHLIERELLNPSSSSLGIAINPIRPDGGLTPYIDPYSPVIENTTLEFYKDNSSIKIQSNQLIGKVDIRIKVRERNGTDQIHTNNGTYILGYRILSSDGNTIVYEPADSGIKYRFYRLPNNSDVHKVFVKNVATLSNPVYWLTNGNGESQINSTLSVANNYLDTDLLDPGNYLLQVFSEDTRGNKASEKFPIFVTKLPPELRTVIAKNDTLILSWDKYKISNLSGYRIYYSDDQTLDNWKLAADENTLTSLSTKVTFNNPSNFLEPSNKSQFYFYLVAVDSDGNESISSDVYSALLRTDNTPKTIIVDGFDRYGGSGSWSEPQHNFNTFYFDAVLDNFSTKISSCSNEAVINEEVELTDYDVVIWFLGDETIQDNTLVNTEQYKLALFLENGGKLFISGEDIGRDLDTKHSYNEFSDTLFYHQYLKSKFMHDGLPILFEVYGENGTPFQGFHTTFGETYPVDAPDDIEPINGAFPILNYTYERDSTFRKGGIAYIGNFGSSSEIGSLVYFSFGFETIGDKDIRLDAMHKVLATLNAIVVPSVGDNLLLPNELRLEQNYPNPFNPTTTIKYTIPSSVMLNSFQHLNNETPKQVRGDNYNVSLTIYDVLGREVATLVNKKQKPGNYSVGFSVKNLSSGIYFYRLEAGQQIITKKMIILK